MKEMVEILTQAELLVEQNPDNALCIKYREIIRNGSFKVDEATLELANKIIETFKNINNETKQSSMKEEDKYEFKDFTTENINWFIKDKIKSKIRGAQHIDCDLSDENFSCYWLYEVVVDNTLYVVKAGYTHQEKPDGIYCEGIQIESKPTNFNKLPTSAEQACIDMNQTFNPDEDGYYLEDIKLENLTQISSCGCTCGFALFKDGEKLTLAIEVGSLDDIVDILDKNNIKYQIQHYDDGFNPSEIDLGNDWEIIIK